MKLTRRSAILSIAGLCAIPAVAQKPASPASIKLTEIITQKDKHAAVMGLGMMFEDADGKIYRQAVAVPLGSSMDEVGRLLVQLGEFFLNPDSRMVDGVGTLTGNELNCATVKLEVAPWGTEDT